MDFWDPRKFISVYSLFYKNKVDKNIEAQISEM